MKSEPLAILKRSSLIPGLRVGAALTLIHLAGLSQTTNGLYPFAAAQAGRHYSEVSHQVLAFYYPWYGTPQRHGHWVHWGNVNTNSHDISASRHYPAKGAYDSYDPSIIDWQIKLAKDHGITGFIASWWGKGSYEDGALPVILESAAKQEFKISVYWETAPGKGREQIDRSVSDLAWVLTRYGTNSAFLKVGDKPVIFVYGRVMGEVPLAETRAIAGDFLLIADGYQKDYARLFDGVHTYNIAGSVAGKDPAALAGAIAPQFTNAVKLARASGRISCLTVIPGYDDTKIRKPGLDVERWDGRVYRALWEEAMRAKPDWVLITSWNEWHEGSEIEPSLELGDKYIRLTGEYAPRFLNSPPVRAPSPPPVDAERLRRLQQAFAHCAVGLLPGAGGDTPFWVQQNAALQMRELAWSDLVDSSVFNARKFPLVIYAGNEHFEGTVKSPGDVKRALVRYLSEGGFLICIGTAPWPLYYDDSRDGKSFPITSDIGLPISGGWEQPPRQPLTFHVNTNALHGLPESALFPSNGDLRWRPAVSGSVTNGDIYESLVQLNDSQGHSHGDGVAYVEHKIAPLAPGKTIYVWMRMPDVYGEDEFLFSLFEFVGGKLKTAP